MGYAEQAALSETFASECSDMAWHKVASLDALRSGEALGVEVGDKTIALFRLGDEIHATDGICAHAYATLAEGFVEGDAIECPLHQALFDIRTGKVLAGPATESLKVYPVKVVGGDVLVELGGAESASKAPATMAAAPRDDGVKSQAHAGNGQPKSRSMTDNGEPIIAKKQYVWPGNAL